AWAHEMLQAAVHSMYICDGNAPASRGLTGGISSLFSGVFNEQSPQNFDPPAFRSSRRRVTVPPLHTSRTEEVRTSPSTRCAYGSARPQTTRPSHSMTSVFHGRLQWK